MMSAGLSSQACTAIALEYDSETGGMCEINTTSTLPSDWEGSYSPAEGWSGTYDDPPGHGCTTADIHVSPCGLFVYSTNRVTDGEGSVVIFAVDKATGALALVGHVKSGGMTPRNMKIHPNGGFILVANQDSDNIVVFKVDRASGELECVGAPITGMKQPVCIQFVPRVVGVATAAL